MATVDHFSRLPDSIIHHILSFLCPKAAGRISVLSKTWNDFWSTFPYLDFSPRYCDYVEKQPRCEAGVQNQEDFLNLVDEFIRGRFRRNNCVYRFGMNMDFPDLELLAPRMDHWVGIAVERNVAELDLRVFTSTDDPKLYSVPQLVLVAQFLTILRLSHCKLEGKLDINLPKLRKLCYYSVHILDELMLQNLCAGFPSIEYLELSRCSGLNCVRSVSSLPQLKFVRLSSCHGLISIDIKAPMLHTFIFTVSLEEGLPCEINLAACATLKVFNLYKARITSESFLKLMSELPGVEVLVLHGCNGLERVKISSQKLNRLVLKCCWNLSVAEIDAPNLFSLEYYNRTMPFVSMRSLHLQEVHIEFQILNGMLWFTRLKDFLLKLGLFEDLKLVIHSVGRDMIIHHKLSEVSLSSLYNLKVWKSFICISSMNYADLLDKLIGVNFPRTVSVISSCCNPIEELESQLQSETIPKSWRKILVAASQGTADKMNPAWKDFLEAHSTVRNKTTTLLLKWRCGQVNRLLN